MKLIASFKAPDQSKMLPHTRWILLGVFITTNLTLSLALPATNISSHGMIKPLPKNVPTDKKICETPGCIHAASDILNFMDLTVNPCHDFYRFSCGKFLKESVIPDEKSKVDTFSKINDNLEKQLRTSIQNGINNSDPRAFQLLQTYFKTCMDTEKIDETSEHDFHEIMKKLGGWPVLEGDSWDESSFDWKKSVYKFRNMGYSIDFFIDFEVGVDMKDNSRRVIHLDQASLGIPQEYLVKGLEEKVVQAYLKYMVDFAEIFGANREQAEKELTESLNFEIALAKISLVHVVQNKETDAIEYEMQGRLELGGRIRQSLSIRILDHFISLPNEKRRNMTELYNPMSVKQLESDYPAIPWAEFMNELLAPHARVEPLEQVVVVVPSFVKALAELLAETPRRVLANYAMWRVAGESAGLMDDRVQNAQAHFKASLTGTSVRQPRWKECVGYAASSLPLATGALYVRRYFDEGAKANAVALIQRIRKSFQSLLEKVDWMDGATRKAALEKLAWIVPHIAYPNEFLDDNKLDEHYQYLKMYPESYLRSQLSIRLFNMANNFEQLRKPVNKTDWRSHGQSAIVNAFYDPTENSIQFPAGILQGEFFSNDRPNYLNYGGIGYVMGHEMTHGFDDQGRQFDKEGNLVEWWQPSTKQKYLQRAQCIIDQYSNYTVKEVGLKINGINTQGENIADNGGIKEAYFAYNDWEKRHGVEPRLPGLPYTSQQMFWIGAATVWCNKYRPEALKTRVLTDVHSPGEFRVLGPMSNMPEFSSDFNCPLGSPMHPTHRCTVW